MKRCWLLVLVVCALHARADVILREDLVTYARAHVQNGGDPLLFVCARTQKGISEQWLVLLQDPVKVGGSSGSGLGLVGAFMKTLYTSTGHRYRFDDAPVGVRVQFIGPFREGAHDVRTSESLIKVNAVYLDVGLYDAAKLFYGMQAEGRKDPQTSYFLSNSFSAEQIARDTKRAADEKFSIEDERTYAKSIFALIQFGAVGFSTRGLDRVLEDVVDKPGIFSGAFTQIDWSAIKAVDLTGGRRFVVPFAFQTKSSIKGSLTIEKPAGKTVRCGGITTIEISESSKSPDTHVTLRMIAGSELDPR
jgi:hypothetical protein